MIRINLLEAPYGKPRPEPRSIAKFVIAAVVVVLVCGAGGAFWMYRGQIVHWVQQQQDHQQKQYEAAKQVSSPATAKETILKDVVKEVTETGSRLSLGVLNLPYNDLSFSEKMAYEALFAKNVAALLARAVPAGIGLWSIETDNFQTVYAAGIAPSKELIQDMFSSLRNQKTEFLPKPLTQITPNAGDGYKFVFTGKVEFGLNSADPIVLAPVPSNKGLTQELQIFEQSAKENSVTLTKKLTRVSSEKVGSYNRHVYQWSGTCTYKNFVRLVLRLDQMKRFYAFKRISLGPLSGPSIKVESQVLLTTRD